MTNADFPRGFQAVDDKGTEIVNLEASVDSSNGNSIGAGDAISIEIDGNIRRANNTDFEELIGCANQFRGSDGEILLTLPASTAGKVLYVPLLSNRFTCQTSGTTPINSSVVGSLANLTVVAGDADTTTGQSKMQIDAGTIGSGTQLVIEGKSDRSEWGQPNVLLIVSFNNYQGNTGTAQIT